MSAPSTVLIADDEPAIRQLILELLAPNGYRILEAGDGASALDVVKSTPIDLLITDLHMPQCDAWSAIRELRRTRERSKVLMVSGSLDIEPPLSEDVRVDELLAKPFRAAELLACVRRLLEHPTTH